MEAIIVALITATATVTATIISSRQTHEKIKDVKVANRKEAIRNQILLLIIFDRQNVDDGGLPENFKAICNMYDEYRSLGGNSYICRKVEEYKEWAYGIKAVEK